MKSAIADKSFFHVAVISIVFAMVAALLVFAWGSGNDQAQALHGPGTGAVIFGFDMDNGNIGTAGVGGGAEGHEDGATGQTCNDTIDNGPAGGTDGTDADCIGLGNTSTTLGPIDACVSVSSILGPGSKVNFDTFLDAIPLAAVDLAGFDYIIGFPEAAGAVLTTQTHATAGTTILQPNLPFTEAVPDPPGAAGPVGEHVVSEAVLLGPPPTPAIEQGAVGRYTLEAAGMAAGTYFLTIIPGSLVLGNSTPADWAPLVTDLIDGNGTGVDGYPSAGVFGLFAVDEPCPQPADLKKVDLSVDLVPSNLGIPGSDTFSSTLAVANIVIDGDLDGTPETNVGPAVLTGPTTVDRNATGDVEPDTLEDIQTEIVSMVLTGPSALGTLTVIENPAAPSLGLTEEQADSTAALDFPADSAHEVFVFLKGTPFGPLGNAAPASLTATVSEIPPLNTVFVAGASIDLLDASGATRVTLQGVTHTTGGPAAPISEDQVVLVTETLHNNGPETPVATNIDITCELTQGANGECSFEVTAALYQAPYLHTQAGAVCNNPNQTLDPGIPDLIVTINGVGIAANPTVGCNYSVAAPQILDVHKEVLLVQSVPTVLVEEWDVHCTEPSTHTWTFENEISAVDPFTTDPDGNNNSKTDTLTVDCIGTADLKINGQVVTATDPNGPPLIGDDGFDNDGDTFVDEDGVGDCDGDGDPDDDAQGGIDEDGGDCPIIDVAKTIHNNGGVTANYIIHKTVLAVDPNGIPISANGGCVFSDLPSDPVTGSLAVSANTVHNESFVLDCPQLGFGVDDDGDSPDGINFVDEDPPGDGNSDGCPGICLVDDDDDGLTDLLDAEVAFSIANVFGYNPAEDDDEDGKVDEDGPVSIEVVVVINEIDPTDPHVIDPDLSNNDDVNSDVVLIDQLPFDPFFTTFQDDVDAELTTNPAPSIDCLITLPCKMVFDYDFPGGNPLAQGTLAVPSPEFTLTRASDFAKVGKITALATINPLGLGSCNVLLPAVIDLKNGALPKNGGASDGIHTFFGLGAPYTDLPGQLPDDTPDPITALAIQFSWPSHFDAQALAVQAGFPTADLIIRKVGFVNVAGTDVAINVLVFFDPNAYGAGVAGYLEVPVIGDPDVDNDLLISAIDPDDDNDGIPDISDTDDDGDTTPDVTETTNCTPLTVSLIQNGESRNNPNSDPNIEGGELLIVCNEINTFPGHVFAGHFTRSDIGTTTSLFHLQTCSGENDVQQTLAKDEDAGDGADAGFGVDDDGDTLVDEDPAGGGDDDGDSRVDEDDVGDPDGLPVGIPVGIEVDVTITNGDVPSAVAEELSIVSHDPCVAEWDAASLGGDGTQANVVLDPLITVGPTHVSVLNWEEQGNSPALMDKDESVTVTAKYMLNCSAASTQTLQIESNAISTPTLPDPFPLNNEAMNNPNITASNTDVDGDGTLNADDNCPYTAGPQTDTDGDGLGDACDHDDDGDGIDDVNDLCSLLPEDPDGEEDLDGCPETDMEIFVDAPGTMSVDVSEDTLFTVSTFALNGNYGLFDGHGVIFFELLKSDVNDPNDNCVADWIAEPGDLKVTDTVVEEFPVDTDGDSTPDTLEQRTVFISQLQVTINDLAPFNVVEKTRDYTLHCNARSSHLIFLEEGIAPTAPIQDPNVNDNVDKRTIHIDSFDLADVKIVSDDIHQVSGPSSEVADLNGDSTIDCATDFCAVTTVTVKKVLHNNGPSTADVLVTTSANVPSDCTATLISPTSNPYSVTGLEVSVQTTVFEEWEIECTKASNHHFAFENDVATDELHLRDPDLSNNVGSASLDVEIEGITFVASGIYSANIPSAFQVSESQNFPASGTISNTGSEDAIPLVTQSIVLEGSNAKECTASFHVTASFLDKIVDGGQGLTIIAQIDNDGDTQFDEDPIDGLDNDLDSLVDEDPEEGPIAPPTPAGWEPSDVVIGDLGGKLEVSFLVDLPSHTQVTPTGDWDWHCFAPSTHNLRVRQAVTDPGNVPHVSYGGGSASNPYNRPFLANADLKIVDWFFIDDVVDLGGDEWLIEVPLGLATADLGDRDADSKEKLHNNGPWGPVDATLRIQALAGTGCEVSYEVTGNESEVNGGAVPAAGTVVAFTSAEIPVNMEVSVDVWLAERFGFGVDDHTVRECEVELSKELNPDNIHVIDANSATGDELFHVCLDQDQDGIADKCSNGEQDNCTTVPNPNQEDTDGDKLGDACDGDAEHDILVKFCIKVGPAPVNISDNQGHYMWVLCDIGNHSDHDEVLTISQTLGSIPAGCVVTEQTILPGQNSILLKGQHIDNDGDTLFNEDPADGIDNDGDSFIDEDGPDGEQKIILFRDRFECHDPAGQQLLSLPLEVCVAHDTQVTGINDDGDSETDEDPIDGADNDGDSSIDEDPPNNTPVPPDCHAQIEQVIIDQP